MNSLTAAAVTIAVVTAIAGSVRPRPRRTESRTAEGSPRRAGGALAARLLARGSEGDWRWTSSRSTPSPRAVAVWCDDLARSLRSGSSLITSLVDVVPADRATRDLTAPLRLALQRARPVADAVRTVVSGGDHLRLALTVIETSAHVGGPSAAAIDRTATTLRQRAADVDERAVHASQARLSAHVMTAVPLLMLAALVTVDGDVRATIGTSVGGACVVAGLMLNAGGWFWMRQIVGRP
jgi:Flp pilus assembly protein TadB